MTAKTGLFNRWGRLVVLVAVLTYGYGAAAQQAASASSASLGAANSDPKVEQLQRTVSELQAEVAELKAQMKEMSASMAASTANAVAVFRELSHTLADREQPGGGVLVETAQQAPSSQTGPAAPAATSFALSQEDRGILDYLKGTTTNVMVDGYYAYNFNDPIGRVNALRAYDVSSNAFSLNQAAVVFEHPAVPSAGSRWGTRLDLQFGQATASSQSNPSNEHRPDIYRNIFQAYGTYVIPVGSGLTVDFGKWASSLGYEGNYTKDQMNLEWTPILRQPEHP